MTQAQYCSGSLQTHVIQEHISFIQTQNTYSGGTRLQVGGAVSNHHHCFKAVLVLQKADNLSFAATLGCGLTLIKAGIFAWQITAEEEEIISPLLHYCHTHGFMDLWVMLHGMKLFRCSKSRTDRFASLLK